MAIVHIVLMKFKEGVDGATKADVSAVSASQPSTTATTVSVFRTPFSSPDLIEAT